MSPHNKNKRKSRHRPKGRKVYRTEIMFTLNKVGWLNATLALMLTLGVFLYLSQISRSTTKGFEISDLQSQVFDTREQVRQSRQQVNKLKSVEFIASQARTLNMEIVDELKYLDAMTTGVALSN